MIRVEIPFVVTLTVMKTLKNNLYFLYELSNINLKCQAIITLELLLSSETLRLKP